MLFAQTLCRSRNLCSARIFLLFPLRELSILHLFSRHLKSMPKPIGFGWHLNNNDEGRTMLCSKLIDRRMRIRMSTVEYWLIEYIFSLLIFCFFFFFILFIFHLFLILKRNFSSDIRLLAPSLALPLTPPVLLTASSFICYMFHVKWSRLGFDYYVYCRKHWYE